MDNVFPARRLAGDIERLWRSLKYECTYLHAFETGSELCAGLSRWISYYNVQRPYSTLAGRAPDEAYEAGRMKRLAACQQEWVQLNSIKTVWRDLVNPRPRVHGHFVGPYTDLCLGKVQELAR